LIHKKKYILASIGALAILVIAVFFLKTAKDAHPRIAIVIDDMGYSQRNLALIYEIERPINFSILPGAPFSEKLAHQAEGKGYEVILHLQLEPYGEGMALEPDTIYVSTDTELILKKFERAVSRVPTLKGVSNHMGSKATENRPFMEILFSELKKKNLYFLDTLVTEKSVCGDIASKRGVRFLERDVYLDNVSEADYIAGQLKILADSAKINGFSIGIGHDRPLTIKTLADQMPKMEEEGIEFVFLSELMD
jgi:hypothetical protein